MTTQLKRVTILDADAAVARELAAVLEQEGFEARVTADPDIFVAWVADWLPALAFIDIVASVEEATRVLERLGDARSRTGIVLMSGPNRGGIRATREFGAAKGLVHAGLLRKPFNRAEVLLALARNPHALESRERVADPLEGWSDDQLERALRDAVERIELRTFYQPKISCVDGTVQGFEALARWSHPLLGEIPPSTFIPFAAERSMMRPITYVVSTNALAWLGTARPTTNERVAVNFTAEELKDKEQLEQLRIDCERFNVSPERVALEVTHTSALADDARMLAGLRDLESDGFHLIIDDFGTGYSTAARLAALPFREVKIDTRFVRKCMRSDSAAAIVESLINTARDMGIECTAEGVENQQILDKLTEWGCDNAQGYYIARPMMFAELDDWLVGANA